MDLRDLLNDSAFQARPKQTRDPKRNTVAFRRLMEVLVEDEDSVLQELVVSALKLSGADSAGLSLEVPEDGSFRWVAVAGCFSHPLHALEPKQYSLSATRLNSERPQLFRLTRPYQDMLGVTAAPITDGMLIPWKNEFLKGTLWAVSHSSPEAFDATDYEFLDSLSDFASVALRHRMRQRKLCEREKKVAAAAMAHNLAHGINNPLQSLTNTLFLARSDEGNAKRHLAQAEETLSSLSQRVARLLDAAVSTP